MTFGGFGNQAEGKGIIDQILTNEMKSGRKGVLSYLFCAL